jgi:hypothetical protein
MIRRCVKQLRFSVATVEDLYCCGVQSGCASFYRNVTGDPTHHDGGRKIMTGMSSQVLALRILRCLYRPHSSADSLLCIVDLWFFMSGSVLLVMGPLLPIIVPSVYTVRAPDRALKERWALRQVAE